MSRAGQAPMDLREGEEAKKLVDMNHGYLKDLAGNHNVQIFWDLNKQAIDDQIFILRVDGSDIYLSKQELLRYLRYI